MAKRHRILVADDDDMVRSVMRSLLVYRGFAVEEARDGQDAVQKYVQSPESIDLVLMDLNMPTLDGNEALRQLQNVNPRVKAVLLTGGVHGWDGSAKNPSVRFLNKPFRNDELFQVVEELLP